MARTFFILPILCAGSLLVAEGPKPPQKPGPQPAGGVAVAAQPKDQPTPIDEILMIKPTPYQPTLIRDPFSAPTDIEGANKGDLVDDIGVKGRIISGGKTLAVVSDSRGNIRSLPVGYKFRDGELFEITDKAVIFHQWDVNSTNRSVFRTVVKTFKREEGKR